MTATERKWSERVRGWRESGQTATEFSAGRGFSAGGLRHWAHRLKKGTRAMGVRVPPSEPQRVRLVRVERVAARAVPAPLTVEIGTTRLCVPPGADEATLRATIGALLAAVQRGER